MRKWGERRSDRRSIPIDKALGTVPIEPSAPNTPETRVFPARDESLEFDRHELAAECQFEVFHHA